MSETFEAYAPRTALERLARLTVPSTTREPSTRGTAGGISAQDVAGALAMGCDGTQLAKAWANIAILSATQRPASNYELFALAELILSDVKRVLKVSAARSILKRPHVLRIAVNSELSRIAMGSRHSGSIRERARSIKIDHGALGDLEKDVAAIFDERIGNAASAIRGQL